ncbi:hypothetical protein [Bradyrhizobium sp. USDA 241]|uniref:hypothetical protein n=1 Tax=Bradyrhizobium sp. USDA 241 TaxID=3377725 RepID=UPI003C784FC4
MGKITEFRQNVIDGLKGLIPQLDVDWYDGLFDEHDIADWVLKTPCARVAVMNVPTEHHSTGELNACLRVVCVLIDENKFASLDGDGRAWDMVEQVAIWANQNQFGNKDAGPADKVKFQRLSQPVLRREGVTVGVVEWVSDLMIGTNKVLGRDFVWFNGKMVTQTPSTTVTARGNVHTQRYGDTEELDVTPEVP